MYSLIARSLVIITLFSPCLFAQTAPSGGPVPYLTSAEPDANRLLADRIRFARDMYTLDAPTTDRLIHELKGLVSFQEKYLTESSKSIYRIELAATLVMNDANSSETDRTAKQARFRSQLEAIHARAPMSLSKTAAMVDSMVGSEKAELAHAKMAAIFASKLNGQPFNVAKLDGLIMPPMKMVKQQDVIAQAQPKPATPTNPIQPSTSTPVSNAPQPNLQPATPPLAAHVPPPVPPSPPRDIKPAPPVADWQSTVDGSAKKYKFTPEQMKVAEKVMAQCKARADALKNQPDADKPVETKDGKHKPLDLLYDELVQRVEALASSEQKAKIAPAATPPAAPTGK
jgi:hypothetical protein